MKIKVQKYSAAKESWDSARINRMQSQLFAEAEQGILNAFAVSEMEADIQSGRLIVALEGGGIEQVKISKQKAAEALAKSPDSFYDFINSAVEASGIPARKPASVKEELDTNSTQDEFIEAIATAAAEFIKSNRNAFNLDDVEAVKEFADVFTVDTVRERVVALLGAPEEEEQVDEESEENSEETSSQDETPQDDGSSKDDELVSDDVMALLDE